MVKVGILGIGFMGKMHFGVYQGFRKSKVVALSDLDPKKLAGEWGSIGGNIEDERAAKTDLSGIHLHADPADMFADPDVDVVDITLPTFLHAKYAVAALKAGKHVICEKPMAITLAECDRMIAAAKAAKRELMIAHCIRFWPEYAVLKKIIDGRKYGKVLSARFWRMSLTPVWSWDNWLLDDKRSGGAVVDLHIHDTDYVNYVFGLPKAVRSVGVVGAVSKSAVDSVATQYIYDKGPEVVAEGGWIASPGFGFTMGFNLCLEKATIEYDAKTGTPLTVHPATGESRTPRVPKGDGYMGELREFVNCIEAGKRSNVVTVDDARNALKVTLAEVKSVRTGRPVAIR